MRLDEVLDGLATGDDRLRDAVLEILEQEVSTSALHADLAPTQKDNLDG